ncbi:MAG: hypothetical protein U0U09_05065 [Cyclobacteriaceae bacterium]
MKIFQVRSIAQRGLRSLLPGLIITLSVFGCSDDGNNKDYVFKNQDAQGKIAGKTWNYASGKFRYSDDGESVYITLYSETEDPACSASTPAFIDIALPARVGLKEIGDAESPFLTVLLHDLSVIGDSSPYTYLAVGKHGAAEILTITDTEVTGRIDVRESNSSFVNGNFTVSFCPGS